MSFLTTSTSTKGLQEGTRDGEASARLFKGGLDLKLITSGGYFQIQTHDPVKKPLPSFKLFELQWFLRETRKISRKGTST